MTCAILVSILVQVIITGFSVWVVDWLVRFLCLGGQRDSFSSVSYLSLIYSLLLTFCLYHRALARTKLKIKHLNIKTTMLWRFVSSWPSATLCFITVIWSFNYRNHPKLDALSVSFVDRMLTQSMRRQKGMVFHSFNFIRFYSRSMLIRYRYDGLYRVENVRNFFFL